jgi:hypothetical protein
MSLMVVLVRTREMNSDQQGPLHAKDGRETHSQLTQVTATEQRSPQTLQLEGRDTEHS